MNYLINTQSRSRLIRNLAIASIAGQVVWVAIVVIGGLIEPGYSVIRDAVSVLGARDAAHPWLFDVGVAIWGASFILAAVALLLSVFAMAWRFRGDERWGRFDLFALIGGPLGMLIVGGLFLVAGNEPGGDYGLAQRFALTAAGLWILVLTAGC